VTKKIIATAVKIANGAKEKLLLGNIAIQRDWGYAPEYVKAMWLMLQQKAGDDYVIASGEPHSLKEFVERVFACLGLDWKAHTQIDPALYRPVDIAVLYGSPRKAKSRLNWSYGLSFQELIERLVKEELECGKQRDLFGHFHR
jgi:GDPmannose 4,6-dehydratase